VRISGYEFVVEGPGFLMSEKRIAISHAVQSPAISRQRNISVDIFPIHFGPAMLSRRHHLRADAAPTPLSRWISHIGL
jgi:hypothetical protein